MVIIFEKCFFIFILTPHIAEYTNHRRSESRAICWAYIISLHGPLRGREAEFTWLPEKPVFTALAGRQLDCTGCLYYIALFTAALFKLHSAGGLLHTMCAQSSIANQIHIRKQSNPGGPDWERESNIWGNFPTCGVIPFHRWLARNWKSSLVGEQYLWYLILSLRLHLVSDVAAWFLLVDSPGQSLNLTGCHPVLYTSVPHTATYNIGQSVSLNAKIESCRILLCTAFCP